MSPAEPADESAKGLADEPMSWPVAASTELYRGDWVLGLRQDVISAPGEPGTRFARVVVEDPGAVVVLAVDDQDRAVVVQQYRHPVRHRLLELPAGVLDEPGEEPVTAARRELREEAGLEAAEWTPLVTTWATPGKSEERHHIFLARGLSEVDSGFEPHHEEAEMTLLRVPVGDLVDAVLEGRAQDAPLAVAVLAYDALRRRDRL